MAWLFGQANWTWLVVLSAMSLGPSDPPAADRRPAQPAKPTTLVTISKRTTYLTEPLRSDGYPDYAAALDQRLRRGVTPDHNAVVLFWQAIGPGGIKRENREKYFGKLGIATPPEKGDYFVDLFEFDQKRGGKSASQSDRFKQLEEFEQLQDELGNVMKRPWSKAEHPQIAEWLAANEKPLALLIEASKRTQYYAPVVGETMMEMLEGGTPIAQQLRAAARALTARAMLRINDRQKQAGQEDLLACHRLGRLVSRGPTLIDLLYGVAIDTAAGAGDCCLIEWGDLSAKQAMDLRDQLARLPAAPSLPDRLAEAERYFVLDGIVTTARHGYDPVMTGFGMRKPVGMLRYLDAAYVAMVNWDDVLVQMNEWIDRIVDAMRQPTRSERTEAVKRLRHEMNQLAKKSRDSMRVSSLLWTGPRKAATEQCVKDLLGLAVSGMLSGGDAEDRWAMQRDLTKLSLSLAAYRADHGSYPQKLAELMPNYASAVPRDLFGGGDAPLHYQRRDHGFLLYSVGPNGKDDGGKTMVEANEDQGYDDLTVRIPAAP
ncbi:MAG: hypothetical protein ABFC77_07160 [Thermoguttaceae bacterium]